MGGCSSVAVEQQITDKDVPPQTFLITVDRVQSSKIDVNKFETQKGKPKSQDFDFIKTLGVGASSKVHAVNDKRSGHKYAMKILDKSDSLNKTLYEHETAILKILSHENILEFVDAYEDQKSFNILTRLCEGGELFDRVTHGSFSERVASSLALQMLSAIAQCHERNVVHRDLKPENFVFETPAKDSRMKLIDFGCALVVKPSEVIKDVAGSPYYVAPEVLTEGFVRTGEVWKASDMWSIGVIIFLLVCGYPPFNHEVQSEIFRKIQRGRYKMPSKGLSAEVKGLITKLLVKEPSQRLSAKEALKHPWVSGDLAPDTPLPSIVVQSIGAFHRASKLRKAVARALANRMTADDKDSLSIIFKKFDQNGDGMLGPEEIASLMRHLGKNESEAKELMRNLDEDQNGTIDAEEFATAVNLHKLASDQSHIKAAFDMFDADHDGTIDRDELARICDFLTPAAAQNLIKDVDRNGDGRISFEEWLNALADKNLLQRLTSVDSVGADERGTGRSSE